MDENGDDGDKWTMVPFQKWWFSVLETIDGKARSLTHKSKNKTKIYQEQCCFWLLRTELWACCVSKATPLSLIRGWLLIWPLIWQSGFSPVLLDTVPYLLGWVIAQEIKGEALMEWWSQDHLTDEEICSSRKATRTLASIVKINFLSALNQRLATI